MERFLEWAEGRGEVCKAKEEHYACKCWCQALRAAVVSEMKWDLGQVKKRTTGPPLSPLPPVH
jgi:hypothetical protein